LCMKTLGFTPLAARLPSALAAALTAWLLWQWAKRRELHRVGWLALVIYPLCPLTMGLARQAIMDSLLTLWFTLAVFGWIEGYTGDRRWYLLMAAGAGLATMTKGFIGLLLPGAAMVLWILLRRDWAELKRIPWLPALGLYLLIVLPWHVAVWQATGQQFVEEYIVRHHVNRFLGKEFGHVAPFWFYIPVLLAGMYPWSAFVPIIGWQALSGWRCEREKLCCAWAMWAFWALVVIVFFSLSKSKLPGYVLPAVPALCLLAAVRLQSLWTVTQGLRVGEAALMGFTGIALGAAFALVGAVGWQWRGVETAVLMGKPVPPDVVQAVAHGALRAHTERVVRVKRYLPGVAMGTYPTRGGLCSAVRTAVRVFGRARRVATLGRLRHRAAASPGSFADTRSAAGQGSDGVRLRTQSPQFALRDGTPVTGAYAGHARRAAPAAGAL